MGSDIKQLHVELNGTISEEFVAGYSNLTNSTENVSPPEEELLEDETVEEMLLDNSNQYLTIDKNGYVVRIFNKGASP